MNLIMVEGRIQNVIKLQHKEDTDVDWLKVVVQDSWKNRDDTWTNVNFEAAFFGNGAKMVAEYFSKGKVIIMSGKMAGHRSWEADSGKTYYYYKLDNANWAFPAKERAPEEEPEQRSAAEEMDL